MRGVVHFLFFLFLPSLLWSQSTTPPSTHLPQECRCTATNVWLDIIVAVDLSSSMTQAGLDTAVAFLSGVFSGLSISQQTGRFTRLGIVGFGSTATVFNNLTDFNSTDEAVSALQDLHLKYSGSSQVNFVQAFQSVEEVITTSDERPNVKNLILVIATACTDDPKAIASQLKARGNVIVTIGYGEFDELPPPVFEFSSPGFNFTNKDSNLTLELLDAFCDTNCFCPSAAWTQFVDSTNKKYAECLYPGDIPTTWQAAQSRCQSNRSHLVDELSREKQSFVKKLMMAQNINPLIYWIGLEKVNETWGWDRGNNGILPLANNDYTNWASGYPHANDPNNCGAEVRTSGFIVQWQSVPCTTSLDSEFRYYYCQVQACDTDYYCLGTNDQTTVSPATTTTTTPISTTTTTPAPTASPIATLGPKCDVGQLQYDIVLLFDVGESALTSKQRLLTYAKNVIISFSANFTIDNKGTGGQFAIVVYADKDSVTQLTDFKTLISHEKLNNHINSLPQGIMGGDANDLDGGFQLIYDQLVVPPNTGSRPNADHMVIFFSTKAPDNITAAIAEAKILRNATFCTVGIASGGVDISRVVGGADFAANLNSPADIPTVVQWLWHLVCTNPACPP